MHDNIMSRTISEQLRKRREQLGLSLAIVARRAGTSAASLSRYESGWTQFGVFTLKKLAAALDSELEIRLTPKLEDAGIPRISETAVVRRLRRLFWDSPLSPCDLRDRVEWVTERVLEYGNLDDVRLLIQVLGRERFLRIVAASGRLSPRTGRFWKQILDLEGIPCTSGFSRNTAWIS